MTSQETELLSGIVAPAERPTVVGDRWHRDLTQNLTHDLGASVDAGWRAAQALAREASLPSLMRKPCYRWIKAAAIHLRSRKPEVGRFPDTKTVHSALHLWNATASGEDLRASMFATDATAEDVADAFGLEVEVVQAINDLFFNVLDRKSDYDYRVNIVRPRRGRAGELVQQLSRVELPSTPLEIAFTGTLEDVLLASGRRDPECIVGPPEVMIRNRALAAAAKWAQSPGDESSLSPLVAFGLELVRKQEEKEETPVEYGATLGELLAADLEADVRKIEQDMERKIAMEYGEQSKL